QTGSIPLCDARQGRGSLPRAGERALALRKLGPEVLLKLSSYACVSLGVAAALAVLTEGAPAHAEEIEVKGKGIVGGGLLGAEVVMLGEAVFGVKSGWEYLIGGVVGAGGGALAGHYIEDGADAQVSVYMLAGGMALIIPTTVAVL